MTRVAIAALLFCLAAVQARAGPDIAGTAERVIDGDTFVVRTDDGVSVRVRLWGIDAPERDTAHGKSAAALLRTLFRAVPRVRCETRGMSYKRTVARCGLSIGEIDEALDSGADPALFPDPVLGTATDLSWLLVRAGVARDWPRYSGGFYAAAEADARRERRGLWAR